MFTHAGYRSAVVTGLPERILDHDAIKRPFDFEYKSNPSDLALNFHWGQRKLLLSEIEFLTFAPKDVKKVIYVGAAPGNHIPLLLKLFPDLFFVCYDDPQKFSIKEEPRIKLIGKYFDDSDAKLYSMERVLFISDIRRGKQEDQPTEFDVKQDMDDQLRWLKIMNPTFSSLKFRLPWKAGKTEYARGDIYYPLFSRLNTTEARLFVQKDAPMRFYDNGDYEYQMFLFNKKQKTTEHHWEFDLKEKIIGMDHCYSCVCETLILKNYLYGKGVEPSDEKVKEIEDELTTLRSESMGPVKKEKESLIIPNFFSYYKKYTQDTFHRKMHGQSVFNIPLAFNNSKLKGITLSGIPFEECIPRGRSFNFSRMKDYECEVLGKELLQYFTTMEILKNIESLKIDFVMKNQMRNYFEMFLLTLANENDETRDHPIYSSKLDFALTEAKRMLVSNSSVVDDWIETMMKILSLPFPRDYRLVEIDRHDRLNLKQEHGPKNEFQMLQGYEKRVKVLFDYDPFLAARICIRYSALAIGGQQWGMTQKVADYLYEKGVRFEGFASSLNSKMFGKPGIKYGCLFPEIEAELGGEIRFTDILEKGYSFKGDMVVDPPFIESIMVNTVNIIINILMTSEEDKTAYMFLPYWPDTPSVMLIEAMKADDSLTIFTEVVDRGQYYISDMEIDRKASTKAYFVVMSHKKDKRLVEEEAKGYFSAFKSL